LLQLKLLLLLLAVCRRENTDEAIDLLTTSRQFLSTCRQGEAVQRWPDNTCWWSIFCCVSHSACVSVTHKRQGLAAAQECTTTHQLQGITATEECCKRWRQGHTLPKDVIVQGE
jgi:hypothetical protein